MNRTLSRQLRRILGIETDTALDELVSLAAAHADQSGLPPP